MWLGLELFKMSQTLCGACRCVWRYTCSTTVQIVRRAGRCTPASFHRDLRQMKLPTGDLRLELLNEQDPAGPRGRHAVHGRQVP